jgi:hypothetical protein
MTTNYKTPHEMAKQKAQAAAISDLEKAKSCDSSRHFARPGSAWDTWYTEKYQAELEQHWKCD